MRFLLHLARSALPRPLRLPSIRQLSATPALCARQRRVRTEDPATLRAKAKEQLAELDRRGIDIENSEDGKLKAIGGEEGAEEAIKRVESNREDPEADWFVASKRTSKLDSGDRKESKTTDLETGAKEKDTAAFPHDETKGDFIPRWMRNLSVAERRSAGVLLNEDADDFEIDEEAVATGRAKIVRAEEYTDAALLELLQRENAINIVSIDVRGKMDGVETVIVCSGQTGRQLYRMASRVRSTVSPLSLTLSATHPFLR